MLCTEMHMIVSVTHIIVNFLRFSNLTSHTLTISKDAMRTCLLCYSKVSNLMPKRWGMKWMEVISKTCPNFRDRDGRLRWAGTDQAKADSWNAGHAGFSNSFKCFSSLFYYQCLTNIEKSCWYVPALVEVIVLVVLDTKLDWVITGGTRRSRVG